MGVWTGLGINSGNKTTTPTTPVTITLNETIRKSFEPVKPVRRETERGPKGGVRFGLAFARGGLSAGFGGCCFTYNVFRRLKAVPLSPLSLSTQRD